MKQIQEIKNIQLKRNASPYADFNTLKTEIAKPSFFDKFTDPELQDGNIIDLRYTEDGKVKSIIGKVYISGSTKEIHLGITPEDLSNVKMNLTAFDKSVVVGGTETAKTVKVNLKEHGGIVTTEDGLKLDVSDSDKLIGVDSDGKIKSFITFEFDSATATLNVKGKNDEIVKSIDMPFEAIVKSSQLTADNKLQLVFNTTNGDQTIEVDLSKLVDTYTASKGVKKDDHDFQLDFETKPSGHIGLTLDNNTIKVDDSDFQTVKSQVDAINSEKSSYLTKTTADEYYLPKGDSIDLGTF